MSSSNNGPNPAVELIAEHGGRAERADRFVAARYPSLSRSRIQKLIASGNVLINGRPAKAADPVRAGDRVTVEEPAPAPLEETRAEPIPLVVLFEDEDLIVLDKPAGMVVHPGAGNRSGTLVNALLHHSGSLSVIGGVERPGIVHRLDKETSGCLAVAKNDAAHRALAAQFARRTVEKTYLAVVCGVPRAKSGTADGPIGRHPVHRKKMCITGRTGARAALTEWRVLAEGGDLALVEARPRTGRTHQIRVHLAGAGHPVAGDPLYGRRAGFARHLLHAWRLAFEHPASGRRVAFEAAVPVDFPLVPPGVSGHP